MDTPIEAAAKVMWDQIANGKDDSTWDDLRDGERLWMMDDTATVVRAYLRAEMGLGLTRETQPRIVAAGILLSELGAE